MHGKGEIRLTGKLGDVMKESALAAISFIRSHADKYGIPADKFETTDIHIHVPEGATPKDGPSAGITIATAILSAFTGRPVRKDIAMNGGNYAPRQSPSHRRIEGKGARRAAVGIKNIVIPKENEKDIEEIPESVRKELNFIPVTDADEVFSLAVRGAEDEEPPQLKQAKPKRIKPKKEPVLPVRDDGVPLSGGVRCR